MLFSVKNLSNNLKTNSMTIIKYVGVCVVSRSATRLATIGVAARSSLRCGLAIYINMNHPNWTA